MKRLTSFLLVLGLAVSSNGRAASLDLSLSPANTTLAPGDTVTVDVMAQLAGTGGTLDGGGFFVDYDTAPVDLTAIHLISPFIDLGGTAFDEAGGQARFAFGNFGQAPASPFTLATLDFVASAPGVSNLGIATDPLNPFVFNFVDVIPDTGITTGTGTITVSAVPLPAAVWMMLGGLVVVGLAGVHRRPVGAGPLAI